MESIIFQHVFESKKNSLQLLFLDSPAYTKTDGLTIHKGEIEYSFMSNIYGEECKNYLSFKNLSNFYCIEDSVTFTNTNHFYKWKKHLIIYRVIQPFKEISWTLNTNELLSYAFSVDDLTYSIIFNYKKYYYNSYVSRPAKVPMVELDDPDEHLILRRQGELFLKVKNVGLVYINVMDSTGKRKRLYETFNHLKVIITPITRRNIIKEVKKIQSQPFEYDFSFLHTLLNF